MINMWHWKQSEVTPAGSSGSTGVFKSLFPDNSGCERARESRLSTGNMKAEGRRVAVRDHSRL